MRASRRRSHHSVSALVAQWTAAWARIGGTELAAQNGSAGFHAEQSFLDLGSRQSQQLANFRRCGWAEMRHPSLHRGQHRIVKAHRRDAACCVCLCGDGAPPRRDGAQPRDHTRWASPVSTGCIAWNHATRSLPPKIACPRLPPRTRAILTSAIARRSYSSWLSTANCLLRTDN